MEYKIKINKPKKSILNDKWVWIMAFRDARNNPGRLFLFISSVIIGIAALVSINSFNSNLQRSIDNQAKELLGADFVLNGNKLFEPELINAIDTIPVEIAGETSMASMVQFMTSTSGVRLVRVVALDGDFPFYGEMETLPANASKLMREGKYAMMDANLMSQYDVSGDDSVKVGKLTFKVAGEVSKIPGGGGISSTFTPSVYIHSKFLDSTGLVQYGSRVDYKIYFKTQSDESTERAVDILKPIAKKYGHWVETVEGRKDNLGEGFKNLYRFFNLLAFIALILGCIGVASSVHIYVKEKRESVAVLRCIGSSGWQSFNIFLIQAVITGLIGSIIGVTLGVIIQYMLPLLLQEFIPLAIDIQIAWKAIGEGLLLGLIISILFSALPLISVRFIPPLAVLRSGYEPLRTYSKSRFAIIALIILFPLTFAAYQSESWMVGLYFFLGILVALGALSLVGWSLIYFVKRYFPSGLNFVWRQSLANLFRPNNQTLVLVVVIGLGSFLISTLQIAQSSLLNQVEFVGNENQSNTILFDIQSPQKEGVIKLTRDNGLVPQQVVPIITCRISSINGQTVAEIQKDTTDSVPNWAITREYRVTYRDTLHASEELVQGKIQHISNDTIYVTISKGMHENLNVGIGDSIVFDVQGIPVKTYISGIRDVEWPVDPPNFIFVFPNSVLEEAPQIFVLTTRINSQNVASTYQRQLVALFPNVSLIDLSLVLSTINEFFDKVSFVIRFMALFSVLTGLVVLTGAVINSKYIRLRENVLLRTIGAVSSQIVKMTILEYAYLGFFAAITGLGLSLFSGWLLATYFFEVIYLPDYLSLLYILLIIMALTTIVGWLNTRNVIGRSPLEILRKEV